MDGYPLAMLWYTFGKEYTVCLRYSDIDNIKDVHHDCYLTHPDRSDDTDDMVLDAANQIDMRKKELVSWLKSDRSWNILEEAEGEELDVSDFIKEFNPLYG
jgi:hypothetical protein